jgi:hypothetical protein
MGLNSYDLEFVLSLTIIFAATFVETSLVIVGKIYVFRCNGK